MWNILLVDDDPEVHASLKLALPPDFFLTSCYTGSEALAALRQETPGLILSEIFLPDMSGLEILESRSFEPPRPAFIAASHSADTRLVVDAIKAGADDYLLKPYDPLALVELLHKHLARAPAAPQPPHGEQDGRLVGESPAMRELRQKVRACAANESTILITGESGTGKELVARRLHELSPRCGGPFSAVNCGALPESLFESEMFGSEKGAYTDAVARSGLLASSGGGTLFLDEVGELPPRIQVKLLRVLEDKKVVPLGSRKAIPVDIRVIAATNRRLNEEVAAGKFREDLFYRLDVLRIRIPPLRERREDIPLLCYAFLRELQGKASRGGNEGSGKLFSGAALKKLTAYAWPGNVRELKNAVERAFYMCAGSKIGPEYIDLEWL